MVRYGTGMIGHDMAAGGAKKDTIYDTAYHTVPKVGT